MHYEEIHFSLVFCSFSSTIFIFQCNGRFSSYYMTADGWVSRIYHSWKQSPPKCWVPMEEHNWCIRPPMSIAMVNNYCSRRLHMQEFPGKKFYSTACVYVNCVDELRTPRLRVVRRAYTIVLRARSKKCATPVTLLFSAINFLCISSLCKTKNF